MFSWLMSPFRWVLSPILPPPPKPQPKPFLDVAWRTSRREEFKTDSQYNQVLMKEIAHTELEGVAKVDLLLIGPQQSGKSSLVNSIMSVAKRRKVYKTAAMSGEETITKRFLTIKGNGLLKNLQFQDTVGIIEADDADVTCDFIDIILSGDVNHREKLSERDWSFVTEEHKYERSKKTVHCVIFVFDATVLKSCSNVKKKHTIESKVNMLMDKVKDMGIPFILVLTKIDQLCKEVENDISKTFQSVAVKEAVDTARRVFGFQEIDIYPVKNYDKETKMNPFMDMLILEAVRQAINYSADYLEDLEEN